MKSYQSRSMDSNRELWDVMKTEKPDKTSASSGLDNGWTTQACGLEGNDKFKATLSVSKPTRIIKDRRDSRALPHTWDLIICFEICHHRPPTHAIELRTNFIEIRIIVFSFILTFYENMESSLVKMAAWMVFCTFITQLFIPVRCSLKTNTFRSWKMTQYEYRKAKRFWWLPIPLSLGAWGVKGDVVPGSFVVVVRYRFLWGRERFIRRPGDHKPWCSQVLLL